MYHSVYHTPNGFSDLVMTGNNGSLTGLFFVGSCHAEERDSCGEARCLPVFRETAQWLDVYFSGRNPDFVPPYDIARLTPFQKRVAACMLAIPYGQTVSYQEIAQQLAAESQSKKMSAQAVGGAVGHNPICIIIPCHRVVGANGSLTGYAGGLQNKAMLLRSEGHDIRF